MDTLTVRIKPVTIVKKSLFLLLTHFFLIIKDYHFEHSPGRIINPFIIKNSVHKFLYKISFSIINSFPTYKLAGLVTIASQQIEIGQLTWPGMSSMITYHHHQSVGQVYYYRPVVSSSKARRG